MNILITGGAGYVGSHANKYLSKKGHNTFVVDDLSFGNVQSVKYGKFFNMDYSDEKIETILKNYSIDGVMHFAAFADVGHSVKHPDIYYDNNVTKLVRLLNMMNNANVKNIVFSSTAAVFGEPEYIPIDENHPKKPITPYGKSKLFGEEIIKDYSKAFGLNYAFLRYFNAAGCDPDSEIGEAFEPPHHIIPIIFQKMLQNSIFNVFGNDYETIDGTCVRDYIHVFDLAHIHMLCIEEISSKNKNLEFNMGNGTGFTNLEIIKKIEELTNKKINYKFASRREGDPAKLIASNNKVCNYFNWKPKYSDIEQVISSAWNWELKRNY
jgi:UDP-glucose 4-epimerase